MDLSDLFRSDRIHAAFSLKTFKHKGNERKLLSSLINLDPNRIVNPQQVHSSKVKIVDEPGKILSTDGIISSSKSLVLSIQVADCIPLYLADPENNVIGIVCQHKMSDKLLNIVPSISLDNLSEHQEPNYSLPDTKDFADVYVIGRGIYESDDPKTSIQEYLRQLQN